MKLSLIFEAQDNIRVKNYNNGAGTLQWYHSLTLKIAFEMLYERRSVNDDDPNLNYPTQSLTFFVSFPGKSVVSGKNFDHDISRKKRSTVSFYAV